MAAHDPVGDERAHGRDVVAALLDGVEGMCAGGEPRLVLLIPLRHARVQIPEIVIERHCAVVRLPLNGLEVFALERLQADHDISDLHARVVDVVLDLDRASLKAQEPDQRVAERGVAQVTDVRRLVRVDRGVLDDHFPRLRRGGRDLAGEAGLDERGTIEKQIEVAVRGGLDARDAGERTDRRLELLGNGARRLAEAPGELERNRHRHVTQHAARRRLDHDRRLIGFRQAKRLAEHLAQASTDEGMDGKDHESLAPGAGRDARVKQLLYPCVVVGRVDVRDEALDRLVRHDLARLQPSHVQHPLEVG